MQYLTVKVCFDNDENWENNRTEEIGLVTPTPEDWNPSPVTLFTDMDQL